MSFSKFLITLCLLTSSAFAQVNNDSLAKELYPVDKIPVPDSVKIPVLDFKNSDIKDVLRGLGIQYNVNIFVDPDVSGMVSLYLVDVSFRNAIDFIVKRNNFAYSVENGIIKVYRYQAPPPPAPPKPKTEFHLSDGLLDIDLKEVPLGDVARMFSDSANVNVVADESMDKTISARLVRIKPDKAVKAIFESRGYAISFTDGIYYVVNKKWGSQAGGDNQNAQFSPLSLDVKNGLVSLEVDNASLDQLIRSISVQSGINIVIYDKLIGEITARLSSVPIDDAIRFLLQNTKFTFWKEKSIYFIGSREMNQQKTTVIIPLRHIMADETNITKMLPPSISTNAVVKFNTEHNAIVVIGSFDVVAQAQEFIDKIDKPIPQVLIEALVVDFNVSKSRELGVKLFTQILSDSARKALNSMSYFPEYKVAYGKNYSEFILNKIFSGLQEPIKLPENFLATIRTLESSSIIKVHSTPQIATINGNTASITIGETRYYKLQKETVAPTDKASTVIGTDERFEVMKFNTVLEVTPWVMDDGHVMVKIRPEFNIPRQGGDGTQPPNVDTRVIESMVRLKNGETIVLGGQRQTENITTREGIPFLSSIPIIGWLFSSRGVQKAETQMMIFLTPHVYYGDDNAVSPDDYYGKEINAVLEKYNFKDVKKKQQESSKYTDITEKNNTDTSKVVQKIDISNVTVSDSLSKTDSVVVKDSISKDKKSNAFKWPWQRIKERRAKKDIKN